MGSQAAVPMPPHGQQHCMAASRLLHHHHTGARMCISHHLCEPAADQDIACSMTPALMHAIRQPSWGLVGTAGRAGPSYTPGQRSRTIGMAHLHVITHMITHMIRSLRKMSAQDLCKISVSMFVLVGGGEGRRGGGAVRQVMSMPLPSLGQQVPLAHLYCKSTSKALQLAPD
jgi:hypothetical protein